MLLYLAFALNLILVCCEIVTLGHLKRKLDILRYYTYLQNLLVLCTSALFCVGFFCFDVMPEWVRGLQYITTCGALAAMFIFVTVLGAGKKAAMTKDDFVHNFSPTVANLLLHYICPAIACISLVFAERDIVMTDGIWTALSAVPSGVYWICYGILSAMHAWDDPYQFSSSGQTTWKDVLIGFGIPVSFIGISFVLWNIL